MILFQGRRKISFKYASIILFNYYILEIFCEWGSWRYENHGECSKPCGGGIRTKTRSKTINEVGTYCKGDSRQEEPCNIAKCKEKSMVFLCSIIFRNLLLLGLP